MRRVRRTATIRYRSVVGHIGKNDCVGWTVASLFHFLHMYRFIQPRGSAPEKGDNVTARLYVTCPGPGNTRLIYIRLATSLRSLAIILPLNNSTILTSTFATVSTDIGSYEAIHGRMPSQQLTHRWYTCRKIQESPLTILSFNGKFPGFSNDQVFDIG